MQSSSSPPPRQGQNAPPRPQATRPGIKRGEEERGPLLRHLRQKGQHLHRGEGELLRPRPHLLIKGHKIDNQAAFLLRLGNSKNPPIGPRRPRRQGEKQTLAPQRPHHDHCLIRRGYYPRKLPPRQLREAVRHTTIPDLTGDIHSPHHPQAPRQNLLPDTLHKQFWRRRIMQERPPYFRAK